LFEDSHLEIPKAKIMAIRGPLSARGLQGDFALGDPGLLASLLITPQAVKYDIGVIPHWSDTELMNRFAYGHWIGPKDGAMRVMTEIAKCRRIVTSSLHGAIVADSLGIPRQLEMAPNLSKEGNDFKFRDYAASIGMEPEFGKLVLANQNLVKIRQGEIEDALVQITTPGFFAGTL
jgi:hypothetical protein